MASSPSDSPVSSFPDSSLVQHQNSGSGISSVLLENPSIHPHQMDSAPDGHAADPKLPSADREHSATKHPIDLPLEKYELPSSDKYHSLSCEQQIQSDSSTHSNAPVEPVRVLSPTDQYGPAPAERNPIELVLQERQSDGIQETESILPKSPNGQVSQHEMVSGLADFSNENLTKAEITNDFTELENAGETTQTTDMSTTPPTSRKAEIDTAAPFESVKAAVSLFGEGVDWKSQQQTRQMQASNVEKHAISEDDLQGLKDNIENYRKRISDNKSDTADILLELERVKEKIKGASATLKDVNVFKFVNVPTPKAAEVSELDRNSQDNDAELDKILKEIESINQELLTGKASRDAVSEELKSFSVNFDNLSKKIEELLEERASLSEAMLAAQTALADAEEQVALLKSGEKLQLQPQERTASHLIVEKSGVIEELESKLEEANASILKLKEEIAAEKTNVALLGRNVNDDVEKVKLQLEQAKSEELEKVTKLDNVLAELDACKVKLKKASEDSASLSSAVLVLKEDLENEKSELENAHEKEQVACATLASLQDELHRVKDLLLSAQAGTTKALEAKETLPVAIKQAALEADQAKAAAAAAKEEARKAKQEMEEAKAATSTALSKQAAALKEAEVARASEAMALAEFKALAESEAHNTAGTETESEGGTSITISLEEYSSLKQAANEAEGIAEKKVAEVLAQLEQAKASQIAAQTRLDDSSKEAELLKKELEAAKKKAEEAQEAKLASEAALRKWRAEHEQQRRRTSETQERKLSIDHQYGAKVVTEVKAVNRDKTAGVDSFAQVLSLSVSTPETTEDESNEKEKLKKKTFIKRLTSAVTRKKNPGTVVA